MLLSLFDLFLHLLVPITLVRCYVRDNLRVTKRKRSFDKNYEGLKLNLT